MNTPTVDVSALLFRLKQNPTDDVFALSILDPRRPAVMTAHCSVKAAIIAEVMQQFNKALAHNPSVAACLYDFAVLTIQLFSCIYELQSILEAQ